MFIISMTLCAQFNKIQQNSFKKYQKNLPYSKIIIFFNKKYDLCGIRARNSCKRSQVQFHFQFGCEVTLQSSIILFLKFPCSLCCLTQKKITFYGFSHDWCKNVLQINCSLRSKRNQSNKPTTPYIKCTVNNGA